MRCFISREEPEEPVVSLKSGHLFERRLFLKHVRATGTCPATQEPITEHDIIAVIPGAPHPSPAPPSADGGVSSIPQMLRAMRDEWDAVALEAFALREQLGRAREELGHSVYERDAACRVIARLVKERDGAREDLANSSTSRPSSSTDDGPSSSSIPASVVTEFSAMTAQLHAARLAQPKPHPARQTLSARATVAGSTAHRDTNPRVLATAAASKGGNARFSPPSSSASSSSFVPGGGDGASFKLGAWPSLADCVVTGGADGCVSVTRVGGAGGGAAASLEGHASAVNCVCTGTGPSFAIASGAEDGVVRAWAPAGQRGSEQWSSVAELRHHSGAVRGVDAHPGGSHLATGSADGTWGLCDVARRACLVRAAASGPVGSVAFHPDGALLAMGVGHELSLVDTNAGVNPVMSLAGHTGDVSGIAFSGNGFSIATASNADGTVRVWDLRKLKNACTIEAVSGGGNGSPVDCAFSPSTAELAVVGGTTLHLYAAKKWAKLAAVDVPGTPSGVGFTSSGGAIFVTGADKSVHLFDLSN